MLNIGSPIQRENHLTFCEGKPAALHLANADAAQPSWSAAGAQDSFSGALGPALDDHEPKTS